MDVMADMDVMAANHGSERCVARLPALVFTESKSRNGSELYSFLVLYNKRVLLVVVLTK